MSHDRPGSPAYAPPQQPRPPRRAYPSQITLLVLRLAAGDQPRGLRPVDPQFHVQLDLTRKVLDRVWRDARGLA